MTNGLIEIEVNGEKKLGKKCRRCGEVKPLDEFHKQKEGLGGRRPDCKNCRAGGESKWERSELLKIEVDGKLVDAKKCTGCGEIKPLNQFRKRQTGVGGRASKCKLCNIGREPKRKRPDIVQIKVNGVTVDAKECTQCGVIKPLEEFYKQQGLPGGRRHDCKECRIKYSRKHYQDNPEYYIETNRRWLQLHPEKHVEFYQRRRARKNGLPDDMTDRRWEEILKEDFNGACALLGETENVHMEHFIPVSIGHGGTVEGNVYPMSGSLNHSKNAFNPFEWIKRKDIQEKVSMERWNALVEYLADKNGLTVEEFEEYTYWCFDNPRTPEQAAEDTANGITSLDLWRRAKKLLTNEQM